MNNISRNEEYRALSKQLTHNVLFLLIIITSYMISTHSFAGAKFKEYKECNKRKMSYNNIVTLLDADKINEFAGNGYFLCSETDSTNTIIQCFECGIKIYAGPNTTFKILQGHHLDYCKYSKFNAFFKGVITLKRPCSNVLAISSKSESTEKHKDTQDLLNYENIIYKNIWQKMCQNNRPDDSQDQYASWDTLYGKLKSMKHLCLGVSFDMCSEGLSFPYIDTNYDKSYLAYDSGKLEFLFSHQNKNAFLCLSLMMELERKLQSTISHIDSEQHKKLIQNFESATIGYYHPGHYRWYRYRICHIWNDKRELINDDIFLDNTNIATLFHASTRLFLLRNTCSISNYYDIIETLTKLFYKKVMTRCFYKNITYLNNHGEFNKELFIPEESEIGLIENMRICAFYSWGLFENIKDKKTFPSSVDPRKVREFFSLESIKKSILEETMLLLSCSTVELEANIYNIRHIQQNLEITNIDIDNYKSEFINIFKQYYLNMTEEEYITTIFSGADKVLGYDQAKKCATAPLILSNEEFENKEIHEIVL